MWFLVNQRVVASDTDWYLLTGTQAVVLLKPNTRLSIGRRETDLVLPDDKTISKRQAALHVGANDALNLNMTPTGQFQTPDLFITDESGKSTTVINGHAAPQDGTPIRVVQHVTTLELGRRGTSFLIFHKDVVFCTAGLSPTQTTHVVDAAIAMGAKATPTWSPLVTHLVVDSVKLQRAPTTPTAALAKLLDVQVVNVAWVQALTAHEPDLDLGDDPTTTWEHAWFPAIPIKFPPPLDDPNLTAQARGKMFASARFMLDPDVTDRDVLTLLIESCGGKVGVQPRALAAGVTLVHVTADPAAPKPGACAATIDQVVQSVVTGRIQWVVDPAPAAAAAAAAAPARPAAPTQSSFPRAGSSIAGLGTSLGSSMGSQMPPPTQLPHRPRPLPARSTGHASMSLAASLFDFDNLSAEIEKDASQLVAAFAASQSMRNSHSAAGSSGPRHTLGGGTAPRAGAASQLHRSAVGALPPGSQANHGAGGNTQAAGFVPVSTRWGTEGTLEELGLVVPRKPAPVVAAPAVESVPEEAEPAEQPEPEAVVPAEAIAEQIAALADEPPADLSRADLVKSVNSLEDEDESVRKARQLVTQAMQNGTDVDWGVLGAMVQIEYMPLAREGAAEGAHGGENTQGARRARAGPGYASHFPANATMTTTTGPNYKRFRKRQAVPAMPEILTLGVITYDSSVLSLDDGFSRHSRGGGNSMDSLSGPRPVASLADVTLESIPDDALRRRHPRASAHLVPYTPTRDEVAPARDVQRSRFQTLDDDSEGSNDEDNAPLGFPVSRSESQSSAGSLRRATPRRNESLLPVAMPVGSRKRPRVLLEVDDEVEADEIMEPRSPPSSVAAMDARAPPPSAAPPAPTPAAAAVCSPCNPSLFPSELPPWHAVAVPPPFPLAVPAPVPAPAPCTADVSAAASRSPARAATTASPTVAAILHASTTTITTAPASSPSTSIPPPTIFTSAPIPIVPAPLIPVPILPAQSPVPDISSRTRSRSPSTAAAASSSSSPPAAKRAKLSSTSTQKPSPAELAEKRKAQNRAAQRAFRERRDRYMRDLEAHKAALEERAIARDAEIAHLQHQVLALQNENAYLRALLRPVGAPPGPPPGHVVVPVVAGPHPSGPHPSGPHVPPQVVTPTHACAMCVTGAPPGAGHHHAVVGGCAAYNAGRPPGPGEEETKVDVGQEEQPSQPHPPSERGRGAEEQAEECAHVGPQPALPPEVDIEVEPDQPVAAVEERRGCQEMGCVEAVCAGDGWHNDQVV
ncbi:hypothetical protein GGF31_008833 [Allomyces arbusculus]|nr:hypothetical protein GGF31_008833 [Allomyces arbusculus]